MPPRIYLAGPDVFAPDADQRLTHLSQLATAHGLTGTPPVDGGLSDGRPPNRSTAQAIYHGNLDVMNQADGAIVNVMPFRGTEPDSGTCFEIGYLFGQGKPFVLYDNGLFQPYASALDHVTTDPAMPSVRRDAEGLPIEATPFNVSQILQATALGLAANPDDALRRLSQHFQDPASDPIPSLGAGSFLTHLQGPTPGTVRLDAAAMTEIARLSPPEVSSWISGLWKTLQDASRVVADVDVFRGDEPCAALCVALGFAVAQGTPFDAIVHDARPCGHRLHALGRATHHAGHYTCHQLGWLVEDMEYPLNLMLACSAQTLQVESFLDSSTPISMATPDHHFRCHPKTL